ncbi:hypothetical protein LR48_Vigan267s000100 [Vigna angularis]|uniref:LOB domain-containing protein n=1 Tax=Phaseolus angularis TaxID=3914 RepID=A0A0L9T724_PHAAN|nr:hypothetical protein LR48_Vigan267s000100 [Vigna angularis]
MSSSLSLSNSPCAACKIQRRKCTQECVFAPYFPPDNPQRFAYVHKVFGASNVAKLLNELNTAQREDAVKSLAYEAEARKGVTGEGGVYDGGGNCEGGGEGVTGDGGEGVTGEGVPGDGGEGVPGDGGVVGERGEGTNGLQLKELQSTGSEPRITLSLPHITHTKPRNDVQSTLFIGSCFKNPRALGCVRGHGLGPCPSKVFGVNVRSRSTSSTSSSNAELQTQVSSLTSQVNEMKAMITLLLQNQQGPLPSQFTTFDPSPLVPVVLAKPRLVSAVLVKLQSPPLKIKRRVKAREEDPPRRQDCKRIWRFGTAQPYTSKTFGAHRGVV